MVNQPPRGMRDFYPIEANLRKRIVSTIERTYMSFGFEPYDTPAMEYMDVLGKKSGEEVKKQIYQIDDMGLRFDFTVGLARFISNTSLPKPIKLYRSGPVWRRDEPQKGRFREFWQSDIDIVGSGSMKCEAELIACASSALEDLEFREVKFKINNRECLFDMVKKAGVESEKIPLAIRILDKLDKKGEGGVKEEMLASGISEDSIKLIFKSIQYKKQEFVGSDKLYEIIELVREYGISNIEVDYSLARGLDYYTGPIFEIKCGSYQFSIGGGGRYDDLLGLYGAPSPAVGLSLGIDRLAEIIKEKEGIKDDAPFSQADIYIANIKEETYKYAISVASIMRKAGLNVSLNLTERDLRRQLEYANSMKLKYVAIVGTKEMELQKITLRNLISGEEKQIPIKDAIALVKMK
ncbi:MAG: histidine--tRNA ligase [Candidatus Micrarchaeota archaeon]|nr:histidine--tRNA ligase [Candidatus Micrarchaeota archaeon]